MDVQVKILSKADRRSQRVVIRSFLRQIRPWLESFDDPGIRRPELGTPVAQPGFEIRMQRLKMGLSQAQFAILLDVGRAHLSKIELGIHRPSHRTLEKLEVVKTAQGHARPYL